MEREPKQSSHSLSALQDNPVRPLPTLLLIGAQKAGTSAIADWLFDHGGFRRPKVMDGEPFYYIKEVHFFDLADRYAQGLDFYAHRFQYEESTSEDTQVPRTLDATPDTLAFAHRVHETYQAAGGDQVNTVKILVILRDPVYRELSLYNHLAFDVRHLPPAEQTEWHTQVCRSRTDDDDDDDDDAKDSILSFDDFVVQRSLPALRRTTGPGQSTRHSLYAQHLSQWFALFDRPQQILVLSYAELCHDPATLQRRIQDFVGGWSIPGTLLRANSNDNPYKVTAPSPRAKATLEAVFAPRNEELYQLLESHPGPPMEQRPFPKF